MNDYDLIFDDEDCYGFIEDIIKSFEYAINEMPEDETLKEGLEKAKRIYEEEDSYKVIYKCSYNPMGAYIFTRMVEEK